MKIYGRPQSNESELSLLSEINLVAQPEALRDLASFLYRCADTQEDEGEEWERDEFDSNEAVCPQVIVFNPDLVDE